MKHEGPLIEGSDRLSQTARSLATITATALEDASAMDILRLTLKAFGQRVTLACSFGGPTGMVLLDMAVEIEPAVTVTYIDTDLLFSETHDLISVVRARYSIEPLAVRTELSLGDQARLYGEALWERDPDLCCAVRKVLPQRELLAGYDAWITGLRRDQSTARGLTRVVEWDEKFGLLKVNPLARWTEADVWRYVRERDVPYNTLHDRGYPSIGCVHCTTPVAPGEALMAGRWRGLAKTECGLHGTKT
jgi:phosphoadenosine phosphosulfate reductase